MQIVVLVRRHAGPTRHELGMALRERRLQIGQCAVSREGHGVRVAIVSDVFYQPFSNYTRGTR